MTGVEATGGVEAILRAGGLAPPGARTGEPADPVRARRYRHPALGDRPVGRLEAHGCVRVQGANDAMPGIEARKPGRDAVMTHVHPTPAAGGGLPGRHRLTDLPGRSPPAFGWRSRVLPLERVRRFATPGRVRVTAVCLPIL